MTTQRSTIIIVIVIVAAVVLVALADSQRRQAIDEAHAAATAQAIAESHQATAVANAEIAATQQANAESNVATSAADLAIAVSKMAEAGSNEGTAIANANIAATAQAVAEANQATAIAEAEMAATAQAQSESDAMTAVVIAATAIGRVIYFDTTVTHTANIMATTYAESFGPTVTHVTNMRATAVANYEALAATSTQAMLDLIPTPVACEKPVVYAVLLYAPDCIPCRYMVEDRLRPIQEEFGDRLILLYLDVTGANGEALQQAIYQNFDVNPEKLMVPILIVGDIMRVGDADIPSFLPGMVIDGLAEGGVPLPDVPGLQDALTTTAHWSDVTEDTPTATAAP